MQTVAMDPLEQLTKHVRGAVGSRAALCRTERFDELVRLVVRHWPHRHLEAIERAGGRSHAAIDHAMALMRCQVREQWEARRGVGPLWQLLLAGTVNAIGGVLLDLWFGDLRMRILMRGLSRRAAAAEHNKPE
jgi:hypothetical protein